VHGRDGLLTSPRHGQSQQYVQHPPTTPLIDCILTASQLIRSPTFNRAIQKAYRKINKIPDHEPKNGLGRKSAWLLAGALC
jgi:hypothetical protein